MPKITNKMLEEKLAGQRVLLIGGAGFIGHNLALELRKFKTEVMVADNLMINSIIDTTYDNKRDPLTRRLYLNFLLDRFEMMRELGVNLHNADARNALDVNRIFKEFQPTKVVHLAAIASAVTAKADPGLCFDLQLLTLRNVLEACRSDIERIHQVMLMSSSTVYGDFEGDSVNEDTRPRPHGIYANTKFMAERLLRTYCHQHGLGVSIIRPSALYGERCIGRRVSQLFIENALLGKPLLLEGGGDGRLDFTYIEDLIDGMVRTLAVYDIPYGPSKRPGESETLNITFGNARTISELAKVVQDIVPNVVIEERPRATEKPIRGTLSIDRARNKLGFEPKWPLEEGYKKYCEWYVEQWERACSEVNS